MQNVSGMLRAARGPLFVYALAASAAVFVVALTLSGCSVGSRPSKTIKISFPKIASQNSDKLRSAISNASVSTGTTPQSLADFTCFGVMVSGPGVSADSRVSCPGSMEAVGKFAGLAAVDGGTLEVTVPQGAARKFQVFALRSTAGCPSLEQVFSLPRESRFTGIESFYQVASATADVAEDTTLSIQISFDPSNASKLLAGCLGEEPTPAPSPSVTATPWPPLPVSIQQGAGTVQGSQGGRVKIQGKVSIGGAGISEMTGPGIRLRAGSIGSIQ